ncbi:hypothetical protein [Nocardioides sp. KR10-350]|uniref:hypothetical protein n=1 Tax=Nocardioides cheoyonin TaxID=3156615 RepID=UPI0032B4A168
MTGPAMTEALRALEQAIAPPRPGTPVGNWRWSVRQRLGGVRDALAAEDTVTAAGNAWLAARGGTALRERGSLLSRVAHLGTDVLDRPDVERLRAELRRLVVDLNHHVQRLNDLAYDEVELELGGED